MQSRVVERLELEVDLRRACERDELRLFFQPILNVPGRELVGFEALLRWIHPTRGLISPMQFIPIAEENRYDYRDRTMGPQGSRFDSWRSWRIRHSRRHSLTLNINISPKQFTSGLVPTVREALAGGSIPEGALKLELTETVVMADVTRSVELMRELRQAGCRLVVDDFGTGYSSLGLFVHAAPGWSEESIDLSSVAQMERHSMPRS